MKNLGIHPLAVSLDARKTLPKGCESIVTIQELYMTSPENKKGQLQKNYRTVFQHLPLPLFFFRGNVRKKNIFPQKLVKNGALHRVGSLKNSMSWNCISKLSMAIEGTPPRMAYLRDNGGSIVPEKRPAISWGFTWPWEGGWAPLDCHGMLGISPNISRKARPSASCAMPRKPTVFRTWSWRGLKFNTGASPPQ